MCLFRKYTPDSVDQGLNVPNYLDLISRNIAANVLIAVIVAVHYAVKQGDKYSLKTLLDNLSHKQRVQPLFTQDRDGNTALHEATLQGQTETVKTLLDNVAPEQQLQLLPVKNRKSNTASQEASGRFGTTDTMRTLEHYQIAANYKVNYRKTVKFT